MSLQTASARRPPEDGPSGRSSGGLRRYLSRLDVLHVVLAVLGALPTLALAFLVYKMVAEAYPAIAFNGLSFLTTKVFTFGNQGYGSAALVHHHGYAAPAGAHYGVLAFLVGTVLSSAIAVVIAVPLAVGGAILLGEKLPPPLQAPLGVFLELLAGIPSVIFGLWGVYTLGPWLSRTIYRPIAGLGVPFFSSGVEANGQGLLTAGLVLAFMIIPIIASITRELVRSVPPLTREGALALGLTGSESVRVVTIPFIRTGIVAAAVLGLARALGETIAVLIISGNALNTYPHSIFAPFATMASTIAALLDSALTDPTGMAVHALAEVGLLLLVVTLVANLGGRALANRLATGGLPVGRGI